MDKESKYFTLNDLNEVYAATYTVGASNPKAMLNSLVDIARKAQGEILDKVCKNSVWTEHPCVKMWLGHWSYLEGISIGPEEEWVKEMEDLIISRSREAA